MSSGAPSGAKSAVVTNIDLQHAVCRGGYAVLIFSGHREALGEIAGEVTAFTPWKFVLDDPMLAAGVDFARSSGSTLPRWPPGEIRPIAGACFVFSSANHPAVESLLDAGAAADEHFIITEGLFAEAGASDLASHLSSLLRAARGDGRIAVLGYGHQGRRIVACLRDVLHVPPERQIVHDSNVESRRAAIRDGLGATDDDAVLEEVAAVIASPLARYPHIGALLDRARLAGLPVFDNASAASGLQHWLRRGDVLLDEAAARALRIECAPQNHAYVMWCEDVALRPLLTAHVVREDRRVFAGVEIPHLHSGQMHAFAYAEEIDLQQRWPGDGLAVNTFMGLRRAFVSPRNRADLGFFAAREVCLDLWSDATRRAFPSRHVVDLGATAFERLLKAHLDAREIVSTMQTPAQRVALGIAAAHYASSRPIIEIGSAFGGSALLMAAATESNRSHIISIDPDAPTRDIMRFAFEREGQGDRLRQIVKTSDDAIDQLKNLKQSCGLIFIDGLHTAEAVLRDFRNYAPLVAIEGAIAFHDVCPAIHSVMQTVVEHVLPDRQFRAKCLVDGLLVLERVGCR